MRSVVLPCGLLVANLLTPAVAQGNAWRHPDGTTHFYRAVHAPGGINWHDANAAAARAGGYLATIGSQQENAIVAALITAGTFWTPDSDGKTYNGPWIGGVQWPCSAEPGGCWAWAEPGATAYSNWSPGQPDDRGGSATRNADRIHFGGATSAGVDTWGDAPADTRLPGYVIEFANPTVPRTAGLLLDGAAADLGYTLIDPMNGKTTWLVDHRGRAVRSWTSAYVPGHACYLLPNGNLLRCGKVDFPTGPAGGHGGVVEERDWDGNLVWSFTLASDNEILHHDIKRLPNGNTLMIVWYSLTPQEAIDAGRDPAKLHGGSLWPDRIIEVQPTGKTTGAVVWQWDTIDHVVQDFDPNKPNYGDPARHPELVDLNYTPDNAADWMHTNAIDYNAKLDQIMISVRSFDEVWVIDHSTTTAEAASHKGGRSGKGGDLLYRWGNPLAYRAGSASDRQLFRQHHTHWIPDGLPGAGNLLLFNNGNGRPGGSHSSVDEIVMPTPDAQGNYPMTGAVWGPAAPLWTYKDSPPQRLFSSIVSGAQRLPNGNTLVCAGALGGVREVDPNGVALWEYLNPIDSTGPVHQGHIPAGVPDQGMFRAPRYAADDPALKGRLLVPGAPLERHDTVLLIEGSTARHFAGIKTTVGLDLRAAGFPGSPFVLGTSATPGLTALDYRFARTGWDPVMDVSLFGHAPATFQGYLGSLDRNGRAQARIAVPDLPALRGLTFLTTLFVAAPGAPSGIGLVSNTVELEIR